MSTNFKGTDFFAIVGEFKDTYVPIYKQVETTPKPISKHKIDKGYVIFKGQKGVCNGQKGYFDVKIGTFVKLRILSSYQPTLRNF